ncbi:hypothetical protein FALBO_3448 [Fusarium albosuccineum]|uniref:Enoyl reductase (ER) domain-containing protein n=1 Tax=Fusarium albosuccineum TaxID=1237068 RepID=A0A8H4LL72_9HYPO|nr:hypothetical protein FALBO_3448 [Fusarium albosuccineum]
MKALVLETSSRQASVEDLPVPVPGRGEVLIRVHAVALNPVDQIYVSSPIAAQEKRVVGTDFAGVVVEAGPDLANSSDTRTKSGTRVAGFLQGVSFVLTLADIPMMAACSVNDRPGAFAEYIVAPYDLTWAVPSGLSLEEASTISMCGLTAAQGLFTRLGLPSPFSTTQTQHGQSTKPIKILIYGSSTSVGLYAAQLTQLAASAAGLKILLIGVASPSKHEFLRQKPYGYDELFHYRDPKWTDKVKALTNGKGVDFALDCISEDASVYGTHETLSSSAKFGVFRGPVGGRYDPSKLSTKPIYGAVWEGLGVEIGYNGAIIPANPEAREFAKEFFNFLSTESSSGRAHLEPNPVRVMPGGLERIVPDGLALLGSGSVSKRANVIRKEEYMRSISAEKLVYKI